MNTDPEYPTEYNNKIICCDCLDMMGKMPDGCVDIIVTSPPYNHLGKDRAKAKGWGSAGMFQDDSWHRQVREGQMYHDDMPEEDYQDWLRRVVTECLRVSKGLVWVNHKIRYRNSMAIHPLHFLPFPLYSEIVWSRNGSMALNCKRFAPSHEYFYGFGDKHWWDDRYNKLCSVWNISSSSGDGHPCSYPVTLPARLIAASCPPNGIVYDPFMGSGSTAIAAIRTGRKYIGTDNNEKYCAIAEQRIKTELSQPDLPLMGGGR